MNLHLYWIQTRDLTLASIKSRYRKTFAGFLWVIMNPILLFGVQSLVFKKFLALDTPDYYLFLLGGLLPWIFFSSTIQMGTPVFVSQSHLLRSFKINHWVVLVSLVLDSFINFMASFLLVMIPFYLNSNRPLLTLLLLPVAMLPLLLSTTAITISLSILNVFYRDINFVIGFVFNLLFFLTPIFYPKAFVPLSLQWMVDWNPIVYLITPFRSLIYDNSIPTFLDEFIPSMIITVGFCILSILVWKRRQNDFYRKL